MFLRITWFSADSRAVLLACTIDNLHKVYLKNPFRFYSIPALPHGWDSHQALEHPSLLGKEVLSRADRRWWWFSSARLVGRGRDRGNIISRRSYSFSGTYPIDRALRHRWWN